MKRILNIKVAAVAAATIMLAAMPSTTRAQINTVTPFPNPSISWSLDVWGFQGTTGGNGLAVTGLPSGLALSSCWNDGWQENYTDISGVPPVTYSGAVFDNNNNATGVTMTWAAWNGAANNDGGPLPGDANGTYNKQMINGYLNAGTAAWGPNITASYVTINNIPYAKYDVLVYFGSDVSGRYGDITDGTTSYYFSTLGGVEQVEQANAELLPAVNTSPSLFPGADFAFFPGHTGSSITLTCDPLSGFDQWMGISDFQIIEEGSPYVLYGPSPTNVIVQVGEPASFSVIASGASPLTYQWRHNGTPITLTQNSTAQSAKFSIAATASGQDGNYDVLVTSGSTTITSAVGVLTFHTPATDTWNGDGNTWDTSTHNWNIGGVASAYFDTDNVIFNGTGDANATVTLSAIFSPSSITVSGANANPYELTLGQIAGSGSLHVTGNSTLILDTIDGSTGSVTIDSGSTLQFDNNDTAGALPFGPMTNNGTLTFNSVGNYGYSAAITGTGNIVNIGSVNEITLAAAVTANSITQNGAGALLLQGNNSLSSPSGGLVVDQGTVYARTAGAAGASADKVVLNGGVLELDFANEFTGSAMTLNGGQLSGGVIGNNSYDGTVSLVNSSSDIEVGSGDTFTLNSAAGLNGTSYSLNVNANGGSGTLILPGTGNTWGGVTIWNGTLQIGNGGASGSVGSGTITDQGTLAFDLAGNLVVNTPITAGGSIAQNGTGTVTLAADNNGAGFFGNIDVNSGTLLINGTSGSGEVTLSGGLLGGTGTIEAPVTTSAGTTLFAGLPNSTGTLTLQDGLSLGGDLQVNVNASSSTSSFLNLTGGVTVTGGGIVAVHNLAGTLTPGQTFTVLSSGVSSASGLTVVGNGVEWINNLSTTGQIKVGSVGPVSIPTMTSPSYNAGTGTLSLSGTGGYAYGLYNVYTATSLTGPWTLLTSGNFTSSGNLSLTLPVTAGVAQQYFKLEVP